MTKRKNSAGGAHSTKKAKEDHEEEDHSPEQLPTEDDNGKTAVQWALPARGRDTLAGDDREAVTKYAQSLFGQPWERIRTTQPPANWPFLRTPMYKTVKGKDEVVDGPFHKSAALCALYNIIKRDSLGKGGDLFTRRRFENTFDTAGINGAVVASSAAEITVLVLDQDYRVDV